MQSEFPRLLQAAYNFQVTLKDPGGYAHNGKYHIELLYDSIPQEERPALHAAAARAIETLRPAEVDALVAPTGFAPEKAIDEQIEDLERWAADDLRSVNAQIEYLLREQVRKRKNQRPPGERK